MIKRMIGVVIAISFEGLVIILPGIVLSIILLVSFAGPWYAWTGIVVLFCLYVIVMEALKEKILSYFDPTGEDSHNSPDS